jgi:hypothetical protein
LTLLRYCRGDSAMTTVLILSSSPVDQGPLQLGKEHKLIKHSLDSATNREQFRIVHNMATTVDDLRRYLLEHTPTIVHFCGHGAGEEGLCFEDDGGTTHAVNGERLAKLFHLVNEDVKCVVLNACLSEVQAKAISEHIDFVVGMKDEIGDLAALKFSQGFYEAIWAGQSFEKAFKFGCSAIDTASIPQEHIPVILKSPRLGGMRLEYAEDTQKIENLILRFLNSSASERAGLSTQGEAVLPKIVESLKDGLGVVWTSVSVLSLKTVCNIYKEVRTVIRSGLDAFNYTFYLRPNGESFLIDWEATTGYWPIPFNTFKALGSDKPITVRVEASLSDYFNFGYEKNQFVSMQLEHIHDGLIHGYIRYGFKDFHTLVGLLSDGRVHRLSLEIVPARGETSCVLVTKYVSDSWVISFPEAIES